MKSVEKNRVRELRAKGYSISEIGRVVKVSKSSISLWVRDIALTSLQKDKLAAKGVTREAVEKRRKSRLKNENARRQIIIDAAKNQIQKLSPKELWLIGVMLYWAEGGKTVRGIVRFSNSDPEMIKLMMAFFRRICNVSENKFRGHIHIHPHLDYRKAEDYWSNVTSIPLGQFYKTYRKMNKSSGKHKRDNLPLGTMDIYICNTELFLKIFGWVLGIFKAY